MNGNISKLVSVAEDTTTDSPSTSGTAAAEDDLCEEDLPQSFIPVAAPSMAEQETVQQSVQQRQSSQPTLMWPSIGGIPLNDNDHQYLSVTPWVQVQGACCSPWSRPWDCVCHDGSGCTQCQQQSVWWSCLGTSLDM